MMLKDWIKIGCVAAALLVVCASAQAEVTLTIERTIGGDGAYPPDGGTIDVTVTFNGAGEGTLLSLALEETIPDGWAFDSIIEPAMFWEVLLLWPLDGTTGQLDFVWKQQAVFPDDFPLVLTYRLTVPSGQTGDKEVSGVGAYNGGTGDDTLWGPLVTVIPEGPSHVTVPDVVGLEQAEATTAIVTAGLVVGAMTQEYSDTVPVGHVIGQDPLAGIEVLEGSAVDLVVSLGQCLLTVPDLVGHSQAVAETAIVNVGLVVGTVTPQYSDTVPVGHVISQDPEGAAAAPCGSAVDLVISAGPATVIVPDVVGRAQSTAEGMLADAGLGVGAVTQEYSESVPAGRVISQDPPAGQEVASGTTVDLVVSRGPCRIDVPDVVGLSQGAAEGVLVAANLTVGAVTEEYSDTVPPGNVTRQDPPAETEVPCASPVDLVISLGPCIVPDVVGLSEAAAAAALADAGLTVGTVTEEHSDTVPAGSVISQQPVAGAQAACGSGVDLVVSLGPCVVPNVVRLTQAVATAALANAGLTVGVVTQERSDTVPEGRVIRQDPAGGTQVACGSAVDLVISLGPCVAPDVVGLSQAAAAAALADAGFTVGTVTEEHSDTVPEGSVVSQEPAGGTQVACGSAVDLVISLGPCVAPNVVGLSQAAATTTLADAGLTVGVVTFEHSDTAPEGSVIGQEPAGGTQVACGSAVDLVISLGPCVAPNVVGLSEAAALAALADAGLTVGAVTLERSDTAPEGDVIGQEPAGGTQVACGSAVDLVISLGPCVAPDLLGLSQAAATAALADAGLTVGAVTEEYSETVPMGDVMGQDPAAGTVLPCYSSVDLVVSLGPCRVIAPDVVGMEQSAAAGILGAVGLSVSETTFECSDAVPQGNVIAQHPAGGTEVPCASGVALVISTGPCPVTVPNVVGLTQAAAESAIVNAGLNVGAATFELSDTVPRGVVMSQEPVGGLEVAPGTAVDLVVSGGSQPVLVPNVVGLHEFLAEVMLSTVGLSVGEVTTQCSDTVPEGSVISQDPAAGAEVAPGSAVDLVISTGVCVVTVPDVVGLTQFDAAIIIASSDLVMGQLTYECHETVPAGHVISQDPAGGTEVVTGTAVDLVVSTGVCVVATPDVVGMTQLDAETLITSSGLVVGQVTYECHDTVPEGYVIGQDPAAGAELVAGTAVDLVVSTGPCPVPAPDVVGLAQFDAQIVISSANLVTGQVVYVCGDTAPAGEVINQDPAAGTEVMPGTVVDLVVSTGPCPVPVPDVVGLDQPSAEAALVDEGFVVGEVLFQCSDTVPVDLVASQNPPAATEVQPGTVVDLIISTGTCVVPDQTGMNQEEAEQALTDMGLAVGDITYEYSDTVPAGTVIGQDPPPGTEVPPGTPVNLVVSLGSSVSMEDCLRAILPFDGSTIFVPEDAVNLTLALAADTAYPDDLAPVQFSLDEGWVGTTEEPPHIISDFDATDLAFGEHTLCATAENLAHPPIVCEGCATFTLAQLLEEYDLDGNGLPDYPFGRLANDGDSWYNFVEIPATGYTRAVAAVSWTLPATKAQEDTPLIVTLQQLEDPTRQVTVVAQASLLEPGEVGILIVETAPDLTTLLGPEEAPALGACEPGALVTGGQYLEVSILVSEDGGTTFDEIADARLVANPVYVLMAGLEVPPQTDNVSFYSYPTYVAGDAETSITIVAEDGGAWGNANVANQVVTPTWIAADLTSLSVFAPYEACLLTTNIVPAGGGTVVLSPPGPAYEPGAVVDLTAQANAGWRFDHWEGNVLNPNVPATRIRMNAHQTVTAVFGQLYTLTVSVSGEGTVDPAEGDHLYDAGALVTLLATPDEGWAFDHWEGNVFNPTAAGTRVRMNADQQVMAVFVQVMHSLTVSVQGQGEVDPPVGVHTYAEGTVVTLLATAAPGWQFDSWQGNVAEPDADETTITMDVDRTVVAVFEQVTGPVQYTLTIDVEPDDLAVVTSPIGGIYDAGTVVTLTALAKPGWQFDHWEGNVADTTRATTTIVMNADQDVTAVFEKEPRPWGCFAGTAAPPSWPGACGNAAPLALAGLALLGTTLMTRRRHGAAV